MIGHGLIEGKIIQVIVKSVQGAVMLSEWGAGFMALGISGTIAYLLMPFIQKHRSKKK
jgi:hypothetical protein